MKRRVEENRDLKSFWLKASTPRLKGLAPIFFVSKAEEGLHIAALQGTGQEGGGVKSTEGGGVVVVPESIMLELIDRANVKGDDVGDSVEEGCPGGLDGWSEQQEAMEDHDVIQIQQQGDLLFLVQCEEIQTLEGGDVIHELNPKSRGVVRGGTAGN
jgi:hypothetical protein